MIKSVAANHFILKTFSHCFDLTYYFKLLLFSDPFAKHRKMSHILEAFVLLQFYMLSSVCEFAIGVQSKSEENEHANFMLITYIPLKGFDIFIDNYA